MPTAVPDVTAVPPTPPLHATLPFLPPASATPSAPAGPAAMSTIPIDMWSEPSDDISIDPDSLSPKRSSSPAVPVSVALDPFRIPKTVEEMLSEVNRLWITVDLFQREIVRIRAQIRAYDAYRDTMMQVTSEPEASTRAEPKQRKRESRQFINHKPRTTGQRKRRKGPVGERSCPEGYQE